MKMNRLLSSLVCLSLIAAVPARAEFLIRPSDDFSLDARTGAVAASLGMYSTTKNYDAEGQSTTPLGLQKLARTRLGALIGYAPIERLTVFGRLEWVRMALDSSTINASGYGLGDQLVGAAYRLMDDGVGGMHVAAQLRIDLATYDNARSATDGTPYLGDGSMDFTPSVVAWFPMGQSETRFSGISAGAGFQIRGEEFSKSIPWHAQFRSRPRGDGFSFAAGANGAQSLSTDTLSGSVQLTSSTGGGGSALIHAINPSIVNLAGGVGYQFSPSSAVDLSVTKSLFGKSAPAGIEFALGYTYRWMSDARESRRARSSGGGEFVSHSLEAKVLRANDRLNLVRVDKGSADGVEVGQHFDLFENPETSRNPRAVARARVTTVKSNEAALSVIEYYREIWIDEGFVAKRVVQ